MRRGTIQCKNFTGQIVDLNNDSEIIATFSYSGNFDMNAIADAVADKLNAAKTYNKSTADEIVTPDSLTVKSKPKTKEDRLVELKGFYEKELITKEEYEKQKAKILAED